jgi:hypothetical protein
MNWLKCRQDVKAKVKALSGFQIVKIIEKEIVCEPAVLHMTRIFNNAMKKKKRDLFLLVQLI